MSEACVLRVKKASLEYEACHNSEAIHLFIMETITVCIILYSWIKIFGQSSNLLDFTV